MSTSTLTNDFQQSAVDPEHPWPGLSAFTEDLHQYFHGRDREVDDLFRCVRRKLLTVLFGQSGLGKTSLLQAGLFPRLRRESLLPVPIRLDYAAGAPELAAQVKAAIARALEATGLAEALRPEPTETLWEYFHHADSRLEDRDGKPISLVLVLDQFEELFTLGSAGQESRSRTAPFHEELADLIENRAPATLEEQFEGEPGLVERFIFDRQDYRVLICLREDYLPHLEVLRGRMPSIGQNRMRLTRMSGLQAFEAVIKAGNGLVSAVLTSRTTVQVIAPERCPHVEDFCRRARANFQIAESDEAIKRSLEMAYLNLLARYEIVWQSAATDPVEIKIRVNSPSGWGEAAIPQPLPAEG